MSLLQLPDELIAGVADYLEFTDISSLKQSCRRIHTLIKEYKLDKPNIKELSYPGLESSNGPFPTQIPEIQDGYNKTNTNYNISMSLFFGRISKACNKLKFDVVYCCPKKKPERVFVVAADEMLAKTAVMINKCKSIKKLKLHNFKIDSELVDMMAGISVRIRKMHCELGSVELDAAGFVSFCKSFKATNIRNVDLKTEHITDEVFSQILPNTYIHYEGGAQIQTELTDVTLDGLISGKDIQCRFMINNFANKFTMKGIQKVIQKVIDTDEIGLQWNFGILPSTQAAPASRLVSKLRSMPGSPFEVFQPLKTGFISYEINQNPKEIDYGAYDIEEYPDLYDICLDEPDSVGTIEFAIPSR